MSKYVIEKSLLCEIALQEIEEIYEHILYIYEVSEFSNMIMKIELNYHILL